MNDKDKEILMTSVVSDNLAKVQKTFRKHKIVLDDSFFDYELLKTALYGQDKRIAYFLLNEIGCRVRKPNKNNIKEETILHIAVKLNNSYAVRRILKKGASIYDVNQNGDVAIYAGYKNGNFDAVDEILNYCCSLKNLNPKNKADKIHFHIGCIRNNVDAVKLYLSYGFDANSPLCVTRNIIDLCDANNPAITLLHFAITFGRQSVVKLLLENGADCNKADEEGKIPLHYACDIIYHKREKIIEMLLQYKSCPATVDKQGSTPLHVEFYNVRSKNKNIFDMLLSKISEKINYTNDEGLSHFHIACSTNNISHVRGFLDSGVKVDSCVSSGIYSGYTALHFAVLHNQKDVVNLLLKKNAQVNVKTTEFHVTPLHLACEFNYMKFHDPNLKNHLKSLEHFPIKLDSRSNRKNQFDIIKLLILHGADIDAKDSQGRTPLLHSCMIDRNYCKLQWSYSSYSYISKTEQFIKEISSSLKKIIEILLCNKANVNAHSSTQESILHIISKYSSLKIPENLIKLILTKGAYIDAVDIAGLTPLHVAVKASNISMVQILLKHKANVNIKCKKSKLPLHSLLYDHLNNPKKCLIDSDERKIFCALLENGSDVNMLVGEENNVLLHDAIYASNNFVIEQLLNYGADINMEDSLGFSCASLLYLWENEESDLESDSDDELSEESDDDDFVNTFQIIFIHVQKLLALGLYVSDKLQRRCSQLYLDNKVALLEDCFINLDNIFHDCTKELERMKFIKIDNCSSLYSILRKDPHELSKHIRNKNLIQTIKAPNLNEEFPLYSYLLKLQFKRGLARSDLLQFAEVSLCNVINKNLPYLCYDLVLKYLKNEEIASLKAAAPLRALKRKLDDSNSNQTKTLSKLPKK